MSFELGRALLVTEAISARALGQALLVAARDGVCLTRALLDTGALSAPRLEQELSRTDAPTVRGVTPARELIERLPHGLCARLMAVPIRRDPRTGTIDVVVPDLCDANGAAEVGYHLGAPVRAIRAPIPALNAALERAFGGEAPRASTSPRLAPPETPAWGPQAPLAPPAPERPREELVIPLTRRSMRPSLPSARAPALILDEASTAIARHRTPLYASSDLASAVEGAVRGKDRPTTLIPPAAQSVPPPPNTEPRPPTFASSIPPPPEVPALAGARGGEPGEPPLLLSALSEGASVFAQIRSAKERDAVLELLLAGTRAVARKVALFIARRDGFVGWGCTPELGDPAALRGLVVAELPSVLSIAAANGAYLGPMYKTEAHAGILRVMGSASRDVAACPVHVFGRPALVILADELGDTMIATRRMEELARVAGEALSRIVRERAER